MNQIHEILQKAGLSEIERQALIILAEDGPCTAIEMAKDLSLTHFVQANRILGRIGKKVYNASPENSPIREWKNPDWQDGWYHIVAPGFRGEDDGSFYWDLRPELISAMAVLDWIFLNDIELRGSENNIIPRLEGREALRLVTIRERDPILRDQCLQACGYTCSICGLNFEQMYGDMGKEFIHVHHLNPLSVRSGEESTDPQKDLIPICPNCHSVIHRGGRLLAPEDLRKALRFRFDGTGGTPSDMAQ